ncbi:shikimate kinase [Nocardioides cynanchi]|uniref:shikimate kinase n=1 Tax=Nocardioides cynanchi TaxID=2558918 RepID=UPI001244BF62|nr:shikimate kinase [Nocardioides cynanchi]
MTGASPGPRLVLIGPMGAGKTTVGRLLAERWGVEFRDTDDDIEQVAGASVSDIFVESGEEHFRALERAAVARAVSDHQGVLALGGGAVLAEKSRAALTGLPVVFLRVGLTDAASRVGLGASRPLLLGNVRGTMKALLDERAPLYESLAMASVDTDGLTPDEVADRVEAVLGG